MCIVILEIVQLLKNVKEKLNDLFINSKPEPENYQWEKKQIVIVKYHLDQMWYRGTILKVCIFNRLSK